MNKKSIRLVYFLWMLSLSSLSFAEEEMEISPKEDLEMPAFLPPPEPSLTTSPPVPSPPTDQTTSNIWRPSEFQNWIFGAGATAMAILGLILVNIDTGHDSPSPASSE